MPAGSGSVLLRASMLPRREQGKANTPFQCRAKPLPSLCCPSRVHFVRRDGFKAAMEAAVGATRGAVGSHLHGVFERDGKQAKDGKEAKDGKAKDGKAKDGEAKDGEAKDGEAKDGEAKPGGGGEEEPRKRLAAVQVVPKVPPPKGPPPPPKGEPAISPHPPRSSTLLRSTLVLESPLWALAVASWPIVVKGCDRLRRRPKGGTPTTHPSPTARRLPLRRLLLRRLRVCSFWCGRN